VSERPAFPVVAVRDRASGRYLGAGATWTADADGALVLGRDEARALIGRFACEPDALELVTAVGADAAA
jgi:hypothetical protein